MTAQKWRRRVARAYVNGVLSNAGCAHCGEVDPHVLQFDHIDPAQKREGISRMVSNGLSVATISKEIEKTQVLCANCHFRKTGQEQGWYL